jgi:colicin import membrane protein
MTSSGRPKRVYGSAQHEGAPVNPLSAAARRLGWALGLLLPLSAAAAESGDAAAQREAIRHERSAVEARYQQGEAQCKQRFSVSSCVADLQAQRRRDLAALRERELALDEAKRKADAEDNARRLQAKQDVAKARPPPEPRAASAARAASAPTVASAPAHGERARKSSKTADDADAAAARAAAQQHRVSEAAGRREAAEQRNAERAAKGKKSTPLPIPAPLPAASAASR